MEDVTPVNVLTKWRGNAVMWWHGKMRDVTPIGYHWLPLATIDLAGDNRKFEGWAILWPVVPIIGIW